MQVNRLEAETIGGRQILQAWEELLLQGLALGFQITGGGTYQDTKVACDRGNHKLSDRATFI